MNGFLRSGYLLYCKPSLMTFDKWTLLSIICWVVAVLLGAIPLHAVTAFVFAAPPNWSVFFSFQPQLFDAHFIWESALFSLAAFPALAGGVFWFGRHIVFDIDPRRFQLFVLLGIFGAISAVESVQYGMDYALLHFSLAVVALLRLPLFLLELPATYLLYRKSQKTGKQTLQWTPLNFHEMSFFPYPFLEHHLLLEANTNPQRTRDLLAACARSLAQQNIGKRVESQLRLKELVLLTNSKDFAAIAELRGAWLPTPADADPELLAFVEAARYAHAAETAFNPSHALQHLEKLAHQLDRLSNKTRPSSDVFSILLQALRSYHHQAIIKANAAAAGRLPNPFRAGNPLSTDEGPEVFRGRESAAREIEDILADSSRSASLQLLAPRRSGKTSLLKMLPQMLPDTLCVFFDLQAHPVSTVAAFWQKLAEQTVVQAKQTRRASIPPFPPGPPMEAAEKWLAQLDQLPSGHRVLLCIDESERLEDLFPGGRTEFLQLMGLFRATIQHRRRVRLLVSGAAPFSELDRIWDDSFISARQVRLPYLDRSTTVDLLTNPSADFPPDAIPAAVAEAVFQHTGGQPFLVQVYGYLLVKRCNDQNCQAATIHDFQALEEKVIEWAEAYFRDMYNAAPAPVREALDQLAQGLPATLAPATRRWLNQRYLLTDQDRLAIPIFGSWLKFHALV
ncbi:MAG: hypothetical protein JNM66_24905 [Bryobacterales bacterium]|nr:hypothetical protein [Bryobacterales bacterium]